MFLPVPLATPENCCNEIGHIYLQSQQLKEKFGESQEGGISGIPDPLSRQVSKGWRTTEAKLTYKHNSQKGPNEPKPGTELPEWKGTSCVTGNPTALTVDMQPLDMHVSPVGDSSPLPVMGFSPAPHFTRLCSACGHIQVPRWPREATDSTDNRKYGWKKPQEIIYFSTV